MNEEVREVAPADWVAAVTGARAEGFTFLDFLGAVDEIGRSDEIRVVLRLLRGPREGVRLQVLLDREHPSLDTISHLFAGANWHEREAAEEFGITFAGGDPRPLLQRIPSFPLRKDQVLGARAGMSWPGAKEPGETGAPSRRRMVPPGVPDPEVWGERDPEAPAPTPAEIAESAVGGRVRRRPR